jgi:hypothetical protein
MSPHALPDAKAITMEVVNMNVEIATIVSQFGAAGLMGLLWIAERRHAALRDRQLTEAHRMHLAREQEATALLGIVRDNTRAIVTLEQTQRRLIRAIVDIDGRPPCTRVNAPCSAADAA